MLVGVWVSALVAVIALGLFRSGGTRTASAVVARHPVLAPESGRLADVSVTGGASVRAGDLLAVIEVPGLAQELAQAEAGVLAAEEALGVEGADRARRFARDVDELRGRLLAARVELESERALLAGHEADLARQSAPGVGIPEAEIAATRTLRDAAAATAAAREAEVAGLERALADARGRQGAGDGPTASLAEAQAQRDALRARLEASTLRAYADGVVDVTLPRAGQWVQAGLPVLTITEPSTSELVVYVDPGEARELAPGRPAQVWVGTGATQAATVHSVGPSVEPVPLAWLADPTVPQWGVPVTLRVATSLTPGERLSVEF